MKKQIREILNVQPKKNFIQIVDAILRHRQKQLIVMGSVAVIIFAMLIGVMFSKNVAKTTQQPQDKQPLETTIHFQSTPANSTVEIVSSTPTATPTPELTPTPTPDPTLQKGTESKLVQQLQERLMDLNYLDLDESTQLYGPATKYSVELFQRQHSLTMDGIAGPETLDLIYSENAKKYTLLKGTIGSDVDSLQRQLIDLGYLDKATGYYGTETISAVTAFQERNGLSVDGKTGEQTLALIYSPKAIESATKENEQLRSANIATFLEVAEEQLGDPYIFGNIGPDSFDCSGFIYYCLTQAGSSRGRYNAAGYSEVDDWEKISTMDSLKKGDLLFFSTNGKKIGHAGIYIGNGEMIDASSSNGKIVKRSCFTSFWKENFVVARRPL